MADTEHISAIHLVSHYSVIKMSCEKTEYTIQVQNFKEISKIWVSNSESIASNGKIRKMDISQSLWGFNKTSAHEIDVKSHEESKKMCLVKWGDTA